jgi:hypothetical protein
MTHFAGFHCQANESVTGRRLGQYAGAASINKASEESSLPNLLDKTILGQRLLERLGTT